MKTKLTKIIMSSLAFACASLCLAAAMAQGTSATARAEVDRHCSVGMLRGLYLWTFDGYPNVGGNLVPKAIMQGLRFNGDGTIFNDFGTVNIGGFIILDVTGGQEPIRSHRTARAPDLSPRRPKLQHIRRAGWTAVLDHPDSAQVLLPAADWVWERRHACRSKSCDDIERLNE